MTLWKNLTPEHFKGLLGLFSNMKGKQMKRIYLAGAYSGNNVLGTLNNIRKGIRLATEVLLAGFSPFVPWFDFHFQLMLRENEHLTLEQYYNYCLEWLKVSDAILLVPGWEDSKGTKEEINLARKLNIPIYYKLMDLIKENKV